jgi:hypothetical protein
MLPPCPSVLEILKRKEEEKKKLKLLLLCSNEPR